MKRNLYSIVLPVLVLLHPIAGCKTEKKGSKSSGSSNAEETLIDPIEAGQECSSLRLTNSPEYEEVESVLKKNCLSCHSGSTEPDLSTQDDLKTYSDIVLETLAKDADKPMPPSGSMDSDDISTIKSWLSRVDSFEESSLENNEVDCVETTSDGDSFVDTTDSSDSSDSADSEEDMQDDQPITDQTTEKNDLEFAKDLWKSLGAKSLVGDFRTGGIVTAGTSPHGTIVEVTNGYASVNGRIGAVHVKHNYGGSGITTTKVNQNKAQWLEAITVMFQREAGFDSETKNWYWAKFKPDGTLHKNTENEPLGGKLSSCSSCHATAGSGDFLWKND